MQITLLLQGTAQKDAPLLISPFSVNKKEISNHASQTERT